MNNFEEALAKEWKGYVDRGAATVDALEDNTQELAFAKGFYRGWNYPKQLPASENLEEAAESWNKRLESTCVSEDLKLEEAAKHYLYSNILYDDVYVGNPTDKDCIEMFKVGANWQKEQMVKNSIECTVYVDAGGYPYIGIELYDYENDKPLAKVGDKVKVIINN